MVTLGLITITGVYVAGSATLINTIFASMVEHKDVANAMRFAVQSAFVWRTSIGTRTVGFTISKTRQSKTPIRSETEEQRTGSEPVLGWSFEEASVSPEAAPVEKIQIQT